MAPDYNVDDILEEIRRKKQREAQQAGGDTYSAPSAPRQTSVSRQPPAVPRPRPAQQPPQTDAASGRQPARPSSTRQQAGAPYYAPRAHSSGAGKAQTPPSAARPRRPQEPGQTPSHPAGQVRRSQQRAEDGGYPPTSSRRAPASRRTPDPTAAQGETYGEGFSFRASEPSAAEPQQQERTKTGGQKFGGEEEPFQLNFSLDDGPSAGAPRPADATRMDIPFSKRRKEAVDSTQEMEPPVPSKRSRRSRRERPESIVQSQWKDSYAEQERYEQEEASDDDFASPADAPYVAKDLKSIRIGLMVKFLLTLILGAVSAYLAFSLRMLPFGKLLGLKDDYRLALPPFMWPEEDMRVFLIVNLVVMVLAAIVASNVVGSGFSAFFRLRADSDSPAALATLGALVQGIVLTIFPDTVLESEHISLYFPVAIFALACNLAGRLVMMRRVERNFRFLTSNKEKYALAQIQSRDFAREFSRGLGPDVDKVAYSAPAGFFSGFLDKSYAPDYSDSFSRLSVPIVFVLSIVVGVGTALFAKSGDVDVANTAVSAFAAVLCITAPFAGAIFPNLMLGRVSKQLIRRGAMLTGYESAEDFADTSAVVVSDKDLFSSESVMLHGMKVFAEKRIDEAILDAASVILSCDGIMSAAFINMIGGKRSMLKKVDSVVYEDGMGISAWVDGKRVLIGSRELMQNHDIAAPSKDFESRYARDGRRVLYISNSGELSAMFVVSYNADPAAIESIREMERNGIAIIVYTTDPNITNDLVAMEFGIKRTRVRVLPAKLHGEYAFLVRPKERIAANGVHSGGLRGVSLLMRASNAVRKSVMTATIVQVVGIIVGYGLVTLMSFTGSLASASFWVILLFNLAWMLVTLVTASIQKS